MPEITFTASETDDALRLGMARSKEGRSAYACFQCGVCSSSCPFSDALDMMPHHVIKMVQLGMKEQLLDCRSIWICSTCFMCSERCPQGVDVGGVMLALRNFVVKERGFPGGLTPIVESILSSGRLVKITDMRIKERSNLGLPEVPPTDVEAIRKMLKELEELAQKGK